MRFAALLSIALWAGTQCAKPQVPADPNDDPNRGRAQFAIAAMEVPENGGTANVTIRRVEGTESTLSVEYATADDSARAGRDYVAASGSFTFQPGEAQRVIPVQLIDNARFDGECIAPGDEGYVWTQALPSQVDAARVATVEIKVFGFPDPTTIPAPAGPTITSELVDSGWFWTVEGQIRADFALPEVRVVAIALDAEGRPFDAVYVDRDQTTAAGISWPFRTFISHVADNPDRHRVFVVPQL